ncbi:hypothetical protein BCR39DRAFT_544470 [Naematelia encephala]|uniref:Uncharacterized protein n=1 Tax=Naematelia encephala TaxID=71784 RepID=A0A1Y2ASU0_9TREE|nr:hypothetical protein BCR39DRAFT_544470 [Naematelia encephala]
MPSTHPFLTNQAPFLPRTSSSSSISSTSSTSSHPTLHESCTQSSSSKSFYAQSSSSISNTSFATPFVTSNVNHTSLNTTTSQKLPDTDFEYTCLRFMRNAEASERFFGSVSSRASNLSMEERMARRQISVAQESREDVQRQDEAKAVKKIRRFGKLFT